MDGDAGTAVIMPPPPSLSFPFSPILAFFSLFGRHSNSRVPRACYRSGHCKANIRAPIPRLVHHRDLGVVDVYSQPAQGYEAQDPMRARRHSHHSRRRREREEESSCCPC